MLSLVLVFWIALLASTTKSVRSLPAMRQKASFSSSSPLSASPLPTTTLPWPRHIVVDVRIERVVNPGSLLLNGQWCDALSSCDVRLRSYIDVSSARAPWPGESLPDTRQWTVNDLPANRDRLEVETLLSARRNITKDQLDLNRVAANLRILMEDRDTVSRYDIIDRFECPILGAPAASEALARWNPHAQETPLTCYGERLNKEALDLTPYIQYRYRIYYIDPHSPQAQLAALRMAAPSVAGAATAKSEEEYNNQQQEKIEFDLLADRLRTSKSVLQAAGPRR